MLRDDTSRRSESSWSSALHIDPKQDNGWRPCGDYRALNSRTIADRYPVCHIHDAYFNIIHPNSLGNSDCHMLSICNIFKVVSKSCIQYFGGKARKKETTEKA
jgi:hypothetical protein